MNVMSHDRRPAGQPAALRHPHHPCRPVARSRDRRGDGADLRHLDLRAGQPRRAQGLRVRPQPEPDPLRLRALRRRSGERQRAASPSPPAWRRSPPCWSCSTPAATSSPPTISTAAPSGCSSACAQGRRRSPPATSTWPTSTALAAAIRPETRLIWIETPTNPTAEAGRPRGASRSSPRAAASSPWSTTPSPAPTCSGRWSSASTSWCTRPPSISTAIPTWSAASRWSATTPSWPSS